MKKSEVRSQESESGGLERGTPAASHSSHRLLTSSSSALTNRLFAQVAGFLRKHLDLSKPVMLGLSGGPDSLALFHLLLLFRRSCTLDLHVAHVDHRWRSESGEEADQLKLWVEGAGIPFHLFVLKDGLPERNAEDAARQARLGYFRDLGQQLGSQATLLAHQGDDLAETILKRLFEGASLTNGSPIRPVIDMEGLTLWRPLLEVSKQELVEWLQQQGVTAFDDSTNYDPKYLRTRVRTSILPTLSQAFGKQITSPLCAVAAECQELRDLLETQLAGWLNEIREGFWGYFLDLTDAGSLQSVEAKFVIRRLCEKAGFVLSRDALQTACELVTKGQSNRKVATSKGVLYVDRKRLLAI